MFVQRIQPVADSAQASRPGNCGYRRHRPEHKAIEPAKPTVAIVLGSSRTESTDFLISYELFSAAGAYNVYAVAPERQVNSLAGGLEVMPDYSYADLATLLGHAPEVCERSVGRARLNPAV